MTRTRIPLDYFLLVFVLAIPFWLVGNRPLPLPVNLPASALTFTVPVLAASILSYRRAGIGGVTSLLSRALDFRRIQNKLWYVPTLLLAPLIYLLSYAIMRALRLSLPVPEIPWLAVPLFLLMYFIAGAGEELGWMGYAFDPMQERWNALGAATILGAVWVLWHLTSFVHTGNSAGWIFWQSLDTVARRILIVWIYNNTGRSVFAAILFHAMDNLSWTLFPNFGSHYDPFVTGLVTYLSVAIVIAVWGPRTLRWRA